MSLLFGRLHEWSIKGVIVKESIRAVRQRQGGSTESRSLWTYNLAGVKVVLGPGRYDLNMYVSSGGRRGHFQHMQATFERLI